MYLRWGTRQYQRRREWDWRAKVYTTPPVTVHRQVRLVASTRVNGQPRQRTVAYLGGINETRRYAANSAYTSEERDQRARRWFWRQVDGNLAGLVEAGTVTAEQRDTFAAQIAGRIARPTAEQVAAMEAKDKAGRAQLRAMARAFGGQVPDWLAESEETEATHGE